jgi:hypothetical protein
VLGLAAFSAFVIAMGAITVFELVTGKPVSAQVGGSDVSGTTINPGPDTAPTPAPTESPTEQTDSPRPDTGEHARRHPDNQLANPDANADTNAHPDTARRRNSALGCRAPG